MAHTRTVMDEPITYSVNGPLIGGVAQDVVKRANEREIAAMDRSILDIQRWWGPRPETTDDEWYTI